MSTKLKVLLIEDNPLDTRLFQEMLADAATNGRIASTFELECASRLATGLKHLSTEDIDVVLLDLMLPDSQGFDTFAQVYAQAPQVPIIVLSGLDDTELAMKTVREGAQDYLVKGQMNGNLLVRSMYYAMERKRVEKEREQLIHELQDALAKVRTLSGLLPICSSCKKIRDDEGYWNQLEAYIQEHSEAIFTHSLCPECARTLYPEAFEEK